MKKILDWIILAAVLIVLWAVLKFIFRLIRSIIVTVLTVVAIVGAGSIVYRWIRGNA